MTETGFLEKVDEAIERKEYVEALRLMAKHVAPDSTFSEILQVYSRLERLDPSALSLSPVRVALVGTSTLDQLAIGLRVWLSISGFEPHIFIAPFNTPEQSLLDPASPLYDFVPDVVWIVTSYRDCLRFFPDVPSSAAVEQSVAHAFDRFRSLWKAVQTHSTAYLFQNNADIPPYRVFGNYEGNVSWSETGYLREVNRALSMGMDGGGTIVDIDYISSHVGKGAWFDDRLWYHSKHAWALDSSMTLAYSGARLLAGLKGQSKKCLVLDLDNTLWGGVIGDDGLDGIHLGSGPLGEAYVAFQEYLLSLKNRGVLLAVCSKNEEENAKQPFLEHPNMRITLDDISVFVANWENKAHNIEYIAEVMGLGLDSFVFVDDNPAERKLVRDLLPMVVVPELPSDPSEYRSAIDRLALFETVSFSAEDAQRAAMYKDNARRNALKKSCADLSGFLESLEMTSRIGNFDDFDIRRVAQLINKSNQFHLTTTRYTEAQIRRMRELDEYVCLDFTLSDRFGDNGLICVVILELRERKAIIDTWVMSCRVLSRGMENFVFNTIREVALERGCESLVGIYRPTRKNKIVSGLYEGFGLTLLERIGDETVWVATPQEISSMPHNIQRMDCGE